MINAFRVMTFNVRGIHEDGVNAWPYRAELNIQTIKRYRPDLIGIQEAQSGNLDSYAAELTEYNCELGPISIRQSDLYHRIPIYWLAERFEYLGSGSFYLSETPHEWSLSWGARLVRAANWVKLRCMQTGQPFIHLNTHLDHEIETVRVNSAKLIIEQLVLARKDGLPAVITGDFNAVPTSKAHSTFITNGYHDTFTNAGHTDAEGINTFHGFKGGSFEFTNFRIDWILVSSGKTTRLKPYTCEVIRDARPPIYPSDHYPVLTELVWA